MINQIRFLHTLGYCSNPSNTNNGIISKSNSNYYQSVATYTCNHGYELVGSRQMICSGSGTSFIWRAINGIYSNRTFFKLAYIDLIMTTQNTGMQFMKTCLQIFTFDELVWYLQTIDILFEKLYI